jgi:MFS family permease
MSIFGAGSMAGGPIAGWIADTFGWQWSFWVQVGCCFCHTSRSPLASMGIGSMGIGSMGIGPLGRCLLPLPDASHHLPHPTPRPADTQLPVILFCATITTAFLPPAPIGPTHTSLLSGLASLDYAGSFLLLTGVSTLILGFSFHTSFLLPWSHPVVWGCLGSSVILLAMFLWIEGKVEKPLVPMSLLRSRHRLSVLASGFLLSVGNQAFVSFGIGSAKR